METFFGTEIISCLLKEFIFYMQTCTGHFSSVCGSLGWNGGGIHSSSPYMRPKYRFNFKRFGTKCHRRSSPEPELHSNTTFFPSIIMWLTLTCTKEQGIIKLLAQRLIFSQLRSFVRQDLITHCSEIEHSRCQSSTL